MTPSGFEPANFRLVARCPQPTAPPRALSFKINWAIIQRRQLHECVLQLFCVCINRMSSTLAPYVLETPCNNKTERPRHHVRTTAVQSAGNVHALVCCWLPVRCTNYPTCTRSSTAAVFTPAPRHQNTTPAACSNIKTSLQAILVTRRVAFDGRQHQTLRDASL